ncbi:DUF6771 family protein [Sphingomonas sp. BK345]|uniref:DUF6771 family protein n=1 Tax=Sphingomonas sp. BK345 TaxID=2586980 RepID=UPI00288A5AFE|nr:DUF6771 family protein [Sphingomonas sp. BK345]
MTQEQLDLIAAVVSRTPDWIRRDLSSTEPALRQRAEEALAAMLAAAIGGRQTRRDGRN